MVDEALAKGDGLSEISLRKTALGFYTRFPETAEPALVIWEDIGRKRWT